MLDASPDARPGQSEAEPEVLTPVVPVFNDGEGRITAEAEWMAGESAVQALFKRAGDGLRVTIYVSIPIPGSGSARLEQVTLPLDVLDLIHGEGVRYRAAVDAAEQVVHFGSAKRIAGAGR